MDLNLESDQVRKSFKNSLKERFVFRIDCSLRSGANRGTGTSGEFTGSAHFHFTSFKIIFFQLTCVPSSFQARQVKSVIYSLFEFPRERLTECIFAFFRDLLRKAALRLFCSAEFLLRKNI
jgi:hypothetical protein